MVPALLFDGVAEGVAAAEDSVRLQEVQVVQEPALSSSSDVSMSG